MRDLIEFFLHLLSYIKQECFRVSQKRSMSLNLLTLQDQETFLLKFRKKIEQITQRSYRLIQEKWGRE